MEMKEVLHREGREAKNLLIYQFCEIPNATTTHKPPKSPKLTKSPTQRSNVITPTRLRASKLAHSNGAGDAIGVGSKGPPRVRSASTGRDKKSELQARYWALLFGNLQRAVNEIYQTVEIYENISSCQEAILVLENYVRDFKALSEWFKVSWDYESKPEQQRPHSLAWEVRKSNPAPRVRAKSLSSPTVSGKSSPCLCNCSSGKVSPCCDAAAAAAIDMTAMSPRKAIQRACEPLHRGAVIVNVRQLFSSKRQHVDELTPAVTCDAAEQEQIPMPTTIVTTTAKNKCDQYAQTELEEDHLTLADLLERQEKLLMEEQQRQEYERQQLERQQLEQQERLEEQQKLQQQEEKEKVLATERQQQQLEDMTAAADVVREPTALELTQQKLNAMETEVLAKDAKKMPTPPDAQLKKVEPIALAMKPTNVPLSTAEQQASKRASINNAPLKYSSVVYRATAATATAATRNQNKTSALRVVNSTKPTVPATANANTKPSSAAAAANINLRRLPINNKPTVTTAARPTASPRQGVTTARVGPPTNVATRLTARSRTTLDWSNNKDATKSSEYRRISNKPNMSLLQKNSRKFSQEEIGSSTSTLKASTERISSSRCSLQSNADQNKQQSNNTAEANDGWLTVKNRRRSSMNWTSRFYQPTGSASLPALALLDEEQQQLEEQKQQTNKDAVNPAKTKQTVNKAAKPQKPTTQSKIKNAKAKVNSLPTSRKPSGTQTTQPSQPPLLKERLKTTLSFPSREKQNNKAPTAKSNGFDSGRQTLKRQKSDTTGLNIDSLHLEYMRCEEKLLKKKQKNGLISAKSSDASMETSSVDTIIEVKNGVTHKSNTDHITANLDSALDQSKIDIKIQTNCDFSKTIGDLYESISKTALMGAALIGKERLIAGNNGDLFSCEETDEALVNEIDTDEDQQKLVEEQESLERQIRELQSAEIDVDTETDETDCEVMLGVDNDDDEIANEIVEQALSCTSPVLFVPINEEDNAGDSLELRYQALLSDMPWVEREQALATLQAYVSRHPGRAQELHQKLSSPSRRRSLKETLKKYQIKQERAQKKRELLQKEKADKIQQLLARVEDVKSARQQLTEDKRLKMEERLQRAAENREQYLRSIVEKAHDEEKKLKEINFIKNIEAQNKRLDLIESSKETEGRLQDLELERQKKMEEKAAKEAAVERRRQEIELERQRKLEKINESRLEKEQRIGKMQEQKERQRQAAAREKARDREERLLALQAQQQQTTEELQRKILQKQKESARRHEENIEHIRQRALEMAIPTRCNDEARGDAADECCEEHESCQHEPKQNGNIEDCDLSSTVSDVSNREHKRAFKKKLKKLKIRMAQAAEEYFKEVQPMAAYMKRDSQVPKYLNLISKGGGAQGLDRALSLLSVAIGKAQTIDYQCFLIMDGLGILMQNVIAKGMEHQSEISRRSIVSAIQLYRNACTLCPQIARLALLGNSLAALFDVLVQSLQQPEEKTPQQPVELSTELMLACTVALSPSYNKKHTHVKVLERLPDVVSYAVAIGLIDILSRRCLKVQEPVQSQQSVVLSLLATLGLLSKFVDVSVPSPTDSTRILSAAKSSELFGTISMLNACVVPVGEIIPARTVSIAASAFNLLVSFANFDHLTFQEILAAEGVCLKYLDVASVLLKYCGSVQALKQNGEVQAVMIDLVASLGYFCMNNKKNQDLLITEQWCNIVKGLTKLPAEYNVAVYPSLVSISAQHQKARQLIARDFDVIMLNEYSNSDLAKKNQLLQLLKKPK